jgi:hypothetical protein
VTIDDEPIDSDDIDTVLNEMQKLDTWTSKERVVQKWSDLNNYNSGAIVASNALATAATITSTATVTTATSVKNDLIAGECLKSGYNIECGSDKFIFDPLSLFIEDRDKDITFYRNEIFEKGKQRLDSSVVVHIHSDNSILFSSLIIADHIHLLSKIDDDNAVGVVCLSVLTDKESSKYGAKAIMRTKKV